MSSTKRRKHQDGEKDHPFLLEENGRKGVVWEKAGKYGTNRVIINWHLDGSGCQCRQNPQREKKRGERKVWRRTNTADRTKQTEGMEKRKHLEV